MEHVKIVFGARPILQAVKMLRFLHQAYQKNLHSNVSMYLQPAISLFAHVLLVIISSRNTDCRKYSTQIYIIKQLIFSLNLSAECKITSRGFGVLLSKNGAKARDIMSKY
jgi:hypothetical protein